MRLAFLSRAKEKEEEKEEMRKRRRKSEPRMQNNKRTEAFANLRTLRRDNFPGKHFGLWAKNISIEQLFVASRTLRKPFRTDIFLSP